MTQENTPIDGGTASETEDNLAKKNLFFPFITFAVFYAAFWATMGPFMAPNGGVPQDFVTGVGLLGLGAVILFALPLITGFYALGAAAIWSGLHPDAANTSLIWILASVAMTVNVIAWIVTRKGVVESEKPATADTPAKPKTAPKPAAVAPAAAKPAGGSGPKPVKFDKQIAAEGITLMFGTESGNCEELAKIASDDLKANGFDKVQVLDAGVVDITHMNAFANFLVLTSTWGDGDPPSNAEELVNAMKADAPPLKLDGTQFSVLSLGDTSYDQFCKCGKDFDEVLAKYGGHRVFDRVDCDLEFEEPFRKWLEGVKGALKAGGLKTIAQFEEKELAGASA
ncbi:MAG: flavodoxin domain-containing protein [Vampirovibrio sp.]|nr:flavodoxin domain-containing protein [Vampirovibrio sp.]